MRHNLKYPAFGLKKQAWGQNNSKFEGRFETEALQSQTRRMLYVRWPFCLFALYHIIVAEAHMPNANCQDEIKQEGSSRPLSYFHCHLPLPPHVCARARVCV